MRSSDPTGCQCLRCGKDLQGNDTGRPQQYCGDACRRAACRIRRKLEWTAWEPWWKQQPWYAEWAAKQRRHAEEWERDRPERERKNAEDRAERDRKAEEKRKLIESMPPGVRQSYETASAEARRKSHEDHLLVMLKLAIDNLITEHSEVLAATRQQVKLISGSRKLDKLLRAAIDADNEHEALALFAKARQVHAAGEDYDEPVFSVGNLLQNMFGADDSQILQDFQQATMKP